MIEATPGRGTRTERTPLAFRGDALRREVPLTAGWALVMLAIRMDTRISFVMMTALAASAMACGGAKARSAPPRPAASPAKSGGLAPVAVPGGAEATAGDQRTSDVNNDGIPEVTKYYKGVDDPERPGQKKQILVRQDIDLTWDGRVDIWRYFDDAGQVVKEEWDMDYDGNVDETRFFENGVIVRSERDRNNDGHVDATRYYKAGKLERKESDTNNNGQVDRWEYYSGRTLDRVGVDKDHDGSVDTWAKADSK